MSEVRGPYFDELHVGQVFDQAPAITLTSGRAAAHQAVLGNRLRLTLDDTLAQEVTGAPGLASPALVWDTAIGQSTVVTQHVKANLFYRGLSFHRHPRLGDTLRTVTTVDALRENTPKPGRAPTGVAALHIVTTDQHERVVLDFWRCAMLPSRSAGTGHRDDLDAVGVERPLRVPDWDLPTYHRRVPGPHHGDLEVGQTWSVSGGDVVSSAPELARLTGNVAAVHHDAAAAGGQRLVYGGHTIGLAFHQVCRALPAIVTVAGWTGCDHLAPVHENDTLTSRIEVLDRQPHLVRLRSVVRNATTDVLSWTFTAVMA
ncbi:MaoC family dehydratase [Kineosporia rhizophila]|uniref:MaoC family dehydratase n=1 Tax=Kineosporia rhizophila TaxID=84633 RepID=UPI001E5D4268|nr:MaoC family dehydratase [Kineosporia rhizophila]MCE0539686.1 MaoC family dehydratase [Kineosporia rhizophila]